MIYTNNVRKKPDAILKAFENYIDDQEYFNVVYSKKIGYIKDNQNRYAGGGEPC